MAMHECRSTSVSYAVDQLHRKGSFGVTIQIDPE